MNQQEANDLRFRNYQRAVSRNNPDASSAGIGSTIWSCVFSKYGAALIAAVFVFVVLISVRPSFVMEEPSTAFEEGKLSWWRVIVWSVITGLIVLLIPTCRKFFSGNSTNACTHEPEVHVPDRLAPSSFDPAAQQKPILSF